MIITLPSKRIISGFCGFCLIMLLSDVLLESPSAKQSMIALNRQISQLCLQFKQQQTSIVQVVELCRIHNYFDWMDCPIFYRYQIVVLTNKSICEKKVAFMCKLFKATRAGQTCKFLTQSLFDLRSHKAVFYRHYPSQRAINGRRLNFMKPLAFSYWGWNIVRAIARLSFNFKL